MALIQSTISFETFDVDSVPAPIDLYYTVDDAQTIAQLITFAQAQAVLLDPLEDNAFGQVHFTLHFDTAITRAPRAGAQSELTGLQSFSLVGIPSRSYGIDRPGSRASKYVGGVIPASDTDEIAWLAALLSPGAGYVSTDNFYNTLEAKLTLDRKTFRKRRKALNRKTHTVD
jgi:hypothetical protein